MSANGWIWVVIRNDAIVQNLKSLIDSGDLAGANKMSFTLKAFIDKINSQIQQHGCHVQILSESRIIMQIPASIGTDIEMIVKGYEDQFNSKPAVGIGLNFEEAVTAAQYSFKSGEIEMYDPETHSGEIQEDDEEFDRNVAGYKKIDRDGQVTNQPPLLPSLEESVQMENKLIQGMTQQLMGGQQEGQQQQGQQQAQHQLMSQAPEDPAQQLQTEETTPQPFTPRNLLEILLGHPMQAHEDDQALDDHELHPYLHSDMDKQHQQEEQLAQQQQAQVQAQPEQPQEDQHADLKGITEHMTGKIPELMQLAQNDPAAFKQSMNLVNKLLKLKGKQPSEVQKTELIEDYQELTKSRAFLHAVRRGKGFKHSYPVGTRLGRRIKVKLPNGRTTWRQAESGLVQNVDGTPISVKSNNNQNKANQK